MSYAVEVVAPGRTVVARSSRRLPFEPTGWLRDFRAELASACRTLETQTHETLHAVYTSPQRAAVDLENVLTYNVGTGALAAASRHALLLERSLNHTGDSPHEHHYRYELTEHPSPLVTLAATTPLVEVEMMAPPEAFRDPKAGRWWLLAARAGLTQCRSEASQTGHLAPTLDITPPAGWRGHLINLLKPLTDGIVSAFHSHDGPLEAVLDRALAVDAELSPHEMREYLRRDDAPLGPTRLVWPWRQSLHWSPADERIVQLHARLVDGAQPGTLHAVAYPVPSITTSRPREQLAQ